jgi:hypothetical protein
LFTKAEAEQALAADMAHGALVRRRLDLDAAAQRVRKELAAAGLPVIELPMLFTPAIGISEITKLGRSLREKVEV